MRIKCFLQDKFSFHFINVSYCSPQLQIFEILVTVYVGGLSTVTMVFAVFNMKILSRFGGVGRVTASVALVVLSIGWMDIFITISIRQSDNPNIYLWEFYWNVIHTFSIVLITSGCLFIPLVGFRNILLVCTP